MPLLVGNSRHAGGGLAVSLERGNPVLPVVNQQPTDRLTVYNVVATYDVGALVSNAQSFAIVPAVSGFSVNDAGIVTSDGTRAGAGRHTLNVVAYPEAAQGGQGVALNPFVWALNYATPAAVEFPPGSGLYGPAPDPRSVFFGQTVQQGDTWEAFNVPAGFQITEIDGGLFTFTNLQENPVGVYAFDVRWCAADGTPKTTFAGSFEVVDGAAPPVISAAQVTNLTENGGTFELNPGDATQAYVAIVATGQQITNANIKTGFGAVAFFTSGVVPNQVNVIDTWTGAGQGETYDAVFLSSDAGVDSAQVRVPFTTVDVVEGQVAANIPGQLTSSSSGVQLDVVAGAVNSQVPGQLLSFGVASNYQVGRVSAQLPGALISRTEGEIQTGVLLTPVRVYEATAG